ncbi:hypothetical protein EDB81DRAFT_919091 [Dactylonectria macrodidyma]|uniref:Uncharacterized protein n=1 Tax=Dactylonectria macrodidyma TaxID=307937 RepID=A0A9P9JG28_9HYPO|nr:hypothetical protein EDB81DRAFT_919091 [Dactylonectria macrodidyma]
MADITIAEVSAMINAAIILIQLTLPLGIVLAIVGLLENYETTTTWTVVARLIQGSFWPSILRSDYSLHRGVRNRVSVLSWTATFGSILLIVVGLSTPLGLSELLQLAGDEVVSWAHATDLGPMGSGTPSRTSYEYSRLCGLTIPFNCPGVDGGYQTWYDESDSDGWLDTYTTFNKSRNIVDLRIPQNVTEAFTSATTNTTVSSIFDIQYRSYEHYITAYSSEDYPLQNNSLYTTGSMRTLQSLLLNNKTELVQGLVVDTINGGVGFRNHTIPEIEFGSSWQEDLLWIEPVTECVDTNLTIEFDKILYTTDNPYEEQSFLVDNGGFVNLSPDYPSINQDTTQNDPQLRASAYRAAAFNNALAAAFYNLTEGRKDHGKARLGARYNLTGSGEPYPQYHPELFEISIGPLSGYYLPLPNRMYNGTGDITGENWTTVDVGTRRYGGLDVVNISTVGIQVGMIMGAPHLTDGSDSLVLEPKTKWTQNMIACASATRASIKTVKFTANGTSLENVRVVQVLDKIFPDEASMPLWAIERTNLTIEAYSPLWGLVDDKYEGSEVLLTTRKRSLWLPAGQAHIVGQAMSIFDSTPAGAHLMALAAAYDVGNSASPSPGLTDYTAGNNFGLYVRWRDLSRSSETAGKMINLIWTDIMANLVLGVKPGPFSSEKMLDNPSYDRLVQPWKRHIVYDLRYAIPAIILLALWLSVLLGSTLLILLSRISFSALTQLTNQLAPGRIAVNFLNSEACRSDAPTKEWATRAGSLIIGFQRDGNRQRNDSSVVAASQNAGSETTRDVDRADDLKMVTVAGTSGDRVSVPVASILTLRRAATFDSALASKRKPGPESSSLLQVAAPPDPESGTEGQSQNLK